MSVLIKGMEMPTSCDVCPFMNTNDDLMSYDYRYMYCGFPYMGEFVTDYERTRHPSCPLVPVPPHGRLIDADALIEAHFSDEHRIALSHANKVWMRKIIMDAPTIIPAEEGEG